MLHLTQSHAFHIKMGLGRGTNNRAELLAVKDLLLFSIEKGCKNIQIFGDSLLVINWINSTQQFHDLLHFPVVEERHRLKTSFDSFSCSHIYREQNSATDVLSKGGLEMDTRL